MSIKNIAVTTREKSLVTTAKKIARELGSPFTAFNSEKFPYLLVVKPERIELQPIGAEASGPLFVDFLSGKMGYRLARDRAKHELIARAVGYKPNTKLKIIDATAGLGRDGFILAVLGCEVLMLERSPLLVILLEDGLCRAQQNPDFKQLDLQLKRIDAINYLQQLNENDYPDVIYLDPMYPERNKSALVKKELRYLRDLVGEDQDSQQLLELALKKVKKRVVVKRSRLAPTLTSRQPDFSLTASSTRFDIYLIK